MKRTRRASERALKQGAEAMAMAAAMPLAAMVTLSHRLPLLSAALTGSSSWSDPELLRMTHEKVQATGQAALAMRGAWLAGQQAILGYATTQIGANAAFMASAPARPDTLAAFGGESIVRLARLTATLGEIGSRSLATGLRPTHRQVTANAKRLARRKPQQR